MIYQGISNFIAAIWCFPFWLGQTLRMSWTQEESQPCPPLENVWAVLLCLDNIRAVQQQLHSLSSSSLEKLSWTASQGDQKPTGTFMMEETAYCWRQITWNQGWSWHDKNLKKNILLRISMCLHMCWLCSTEFKTPQGPQMCNLTLCALFSSLLGCLGHACIVLAGLHSLTTSPTPEYGHEQNHHSFPLVKIASCILTTILPCLL